MSESANRLWPLLLLVATPVAADGPSVDVIRGSEIVRVTWNESGERREETIREDPTPKPPPRETHPRAARATDDHDPPIQIIVETADTTSSVGYFVVWPRAIEHRRFHVRTDRHRGGGGSRLVARPWHRGHDRAMRARPAPGFIPIRK